MRLAVPVWVDRVSPVFDVAKTILVVDVIGNEAAFTEEHLIGGPDRAGSLSELGVDALICGAISHDLEERLLAAGVEAITGIRGAAVEVVRAYVDGSLNDTRFSMPGCHSRRRRSRQRRPPEAASSSEQ